MIHKFITAPVGKQIRVEVGPVKVVGPLPEGLFLNGNFIEGTTVTSKTYRVPVEIQGQEKELCISAVNLVSLDRTTVEQEDFVSQLQMALTKKANWDSSKVSTTQTIVELIAAIGTYNTSRLIRAVEEAFPSTAQSPVALRSHMIMQGARLRRKTPAAVQVELHSTKGNVVVPAYTQLIAGSVQLFNRYELRLGETPVTTTLFEGVVRSETAAGLGTELQSFVVKEDGFRVADKDVVVTIDGNPLTRTTQGLWLARSADCFNDSTLADGRLKIGFGRKNYGAMPAQDSVVKIVYAVTKGATVNGVSTRSEVLCGVHSTVTGKVLGLVEGGMNEDHPKVFKNNPVGHFVPTSLASTKAQYQAVANAYPGIVDAVIRPGHQVEGKGGTHGNRMHVTAITSSDWDEVKVKLYLEHLQDNTVWGTDFVWQPAKQTTRDLKLTIVGEELSPAVEELIRNAVKEVFAEPKLGFSLYGSDISKAVSAVLPRVRHVSVTPDIMEVSATEYNVLGTLQVGV